MADKKTTKKVKEVKKVNLMADLRAKSVADIEKLLATAKQDLLQLQKSLKANELANPHAVKKMRREIAQMKTVIAEFVKKERDEVKNSNNEGKEE
jgi:ribosomal protein L29